VNKSYSLLDVVLTFTCIAFVSARRSKNEELEVVRLGATDADLGSSTGVSVTITGGIDI
jgi:hypothetical protein